MNCKHSLIVFVVVLALLVGASGASAQAPGPQGGSSPQGAPGTAFTYQGQLKNVSGPITGNCDFEFGLWDSASNLTGQIGTTQAIANVAVSGGLFTVQPDFGVSAFTGDARWLKIAVRCPAGSGSFITLTPRQALTAAPYALYSRSTGALQGSPITTAAPVISQVLKWNGAAWTPASDEIGSGGGGGDITAVYAGYGLGGGGTSGDVTLNVVTSTVQQRVSGACASGNAIRVVNPDGTVTCEPIPAASSGWSLTGNAGTDPNANFLGTTDNVSLTLAVSGTAALRLFPNATSPNVVGGYRGNSVAPGVYGAVIAGGGANGGVNTASGSQATVGGGGGNQANTDFAAIGGGNQNAASGIAATVPGGDRNIAQGDYAFAAGQQAQANHSGTFVWADATGAPYASTGVNQFDVRATGGVNLSVGSANARVNSVPLLPRALVPTANTTTTVDSPNQVGQPSITIGADGLPVVSYNDDSNGDLKVLHCGNTACTSGNVTTTVDSAGNVGLWSSLTIGADGLPVVSYGDWTNHSLKVLHCGNTACTSGDISTTVDSGGDLGTYTSLTIGADGLPVVSYYDHINGNLKVLHCGNTVCTSVYMWTAADVVGDVGEANSIAIGADGLPVVSYYDATNGDLKVLHCGDTACTHASNTAITVDSAGLVGLWTSLAVGADGLPMVSYYDYTNGDLKVLHCGNTACTSGNVTTTVDTGGASGDVGQSTSLTIGADGLPMVSYYDVTNGDLKVLHCGNTACTSGNVTTTVDSAGDVGQYTSLTIGADGLPVVSYWDVTNADLKVLHCANAFCTPYFRRR